MSINSMFIELSNNNYVMFVPPDMKYVKLFRNEIQKTLEIHKFKIEDIFQITLACDEALTNSITANISQNSEETIICKWRIENMKFSLLILDYGKGFKMSDTTMNNPTPSSLEDYTKQITDYQKLVDRKLPFDGIEKAHKNMGKGLKIIHSLMDTVKISFHSNQEILDSLDVSKINGAILEIEFDAINHDKNKSI